MTTNIAIVGASGSVGSAILKVLLCREFHVTVFSRSLSSTQFPDTVNLLRGDYDNKNFLVNGLKGIDALVLCIGTLQAPDQRPFIDAAIEAGVKWIIPSEFGTDSGNPAYSAHVPIIPPKIAIQKYLEEKVRITNGSFMWTGIVNGLILDWSIPRGVLGIDVKARNATLLDNGTTKVNMSTLALIAHAVASLLSQPPHKREGYSNKLVYISSVLVSQIDLLKAVQNTTHTCDADWCITHEDTASKIAKGHAMMDAGDIKGRFHLTYGHVFKEGAGGDHENRVGLSNQALELPKEDLLEVIRHSVAHVYEG